MAQIINKSNHLRKELMIEYMKLIGCFLAAIFCTVLAFFTYGFSLIAALILGIYCKKIKVNIDIVKSGLKGEKEVLKLLSDLPKRYKVIADLHIQGKNTSSQIDYVVVGANGIFVVEAKNIKGHIKGRATDKYLTQVKVGKGGREYKRDMYNPVFQVKGHVIGVSKVLRKNNWHNMIQGMVYFSHDESQVDMQSSEITVLAKNRDDLLRYIKQYKKDGVKLAPHEQSKIVELLKKHVM